MHFFSRCFTYVRINKDYHGSLMTLATILSDSGRSQEGLHLMERAVGVAPQDTVVRNNMAAFLVRQGRLSWQRQQYEDSENVSYELRLQEWTPSTLFSLPSVLQAIRLLPPPSPPPHSSLDTISRGSKETTTPSERDTEG